MTSNKTIAILTGGGDVPGLNPAIRAITIRALREGYRVVGIRRGWAGLVDYNRDAGVDNSECVQELSEAEVNRAGRTGGTFLHTSRTRPSHLPRARLPVHLTGYDQSINDVTKDVLKNLEHIGVDALIPIGGDDTLSYGKRLHDEGVHVVGIPKTMDNDVYGTDYCIGFSTCVTRTIELTHRLRTSAGSHERFLVIEVFGRYAGFTALLPTMAGAADRCLIPEYPADVEHLTELMTYDHNRNLTGKYSVALVSEGRNAQDTGRNGASRAMRRTCSVTANSAGSVTKSPRRSRSIRPGTTRAAESTSSASGLATWFARAIRMRSIRSFRWRSAISRSP